MAFDPKSYIHESDQAALEALQAIPGFSQLMKAFLKNWSERQGRIRNMSSYIRINENQLSKYYDMLPPICEKLGIDIPELYLMNSPVPNAFTSGETNPYIVLTSGLLNVLPDELIPTILAHECGHIACHHVLYRTMGTILLGGAAGTIAAFPFGTLLTLPLKVAFFYWIRCSEYSADRAAVLCDGSADKMSEICMRLAGYDKRIADELNKEEFMKQAEEYRQMTNESTWDKTLEFYMLSNATHPFMAVRALECTEWAESDQFRQILDGTYVIPENKPETKSGTAVRTQYAGSILRPVCPSCGKENDPDAKFCSACGSPLQLKEFRCPECHTELDGDEVFCPKCGKKIKQ